MNEQNVTQNHIEDIIIGVRIWSLVLILLLILLGYVYTDSLVKEEITIVYIPAKVITYEKINPEIVYEDLYMNIDDWGKENATVYTREEWE